MLIDGQKFTVKNTFDRLITVPDCFVVRKNKLGTGNGEAKLYVGDKSEMYDFFSRGDPGFRKVQCFLTKTDLLHYLDATKQEYLNPSQSYAGRDDFAQLWEERMDKVKSMPEIIEFTIDDQDQIEGTRGYIKSNDDGYQIIRELSLPLITYISAMEVSDRSRAGKFYFKLFVDFEAVANLKNGPLVFNYGDKKVNAVLPKHQAKQERKDDEFRKSRDGQGKYRDALLDECPYCPITMINDERLLIASHIKPWACSTDKEKVDPKNGYMLSPLYDRLFDRGLISFTDDRHIIISNWLSPKNKSRIGITDNQFIQRLPMDDKRKKYLKFHRDKVFNG